MRQYVTALVDHTALEGLRYLIVRNEPQDFNRNWVGGDPASYAHFQSVVYQAAHAADPVIKVLNGGTEAVTPFSGSEPCAAGRPGREGHRLRHCAVLRSHLVRLARRSRPARRRLRSAMVAQNHRRVRTSHPGVQRREADSRMGDRSRLPVDTGPPGLACPPRGTGREIPRSARPARRRFLTDTFRALARDHNVVGINWTFTVDPNVTQTPPPPGANDKTDFDDGFGDGLGVLER